MDAKKTILVVEDDAAVRRTIIRALARYPYRFLEASTGAEALAQIENDAIDLMIIDLGLPDVDGLDLVRNFRTDRTVGVLILSGRHEPIDKAIGIEVGADDYLAKPFDSRELAARVKNILRHLQPASGAAAETAPKIYEFDGWRLYEDKRSLLDPHGQTVPVTSGEFALLHLFLQSPGKALSRNQIMDGLYGDRTPAFDRSVDVRVGRLRKKISLSTDTETKIHTIRNVGYLFSASVSFS